MMGQELWSSDYGRCLMFERLWVQIPAPYFGWTIFTLIVVRNCIVCLKRPKMNEKEAGVGPFKNISTDVGTYLLSLIRSYFPVSQFNSTLSQQVGRQVVPGVIVNHHLRINRPSGKCIKYSLFVVQRNSCVNLSKYTMLCMWTYTWYIHMCWYTYLYECIGIHICMNALVYLHICMNVFVSKSVFLRH